MIVSNPFDTTSGSNHPAMGGGEGEAFFSVNAFTLSFAGPIHAVAVFVVARPRDVPAGDFALSIGPAPS